MSTSQVSKQVYIVDVPEVNHFLASFQYNYFTKDEQTVDITKLSTNAIIKSTDDINSFTIQHSTYRAPQFVKLQWKINNLTKTSSDGTNVASQKRNNNVNLISDNFDKIITEDTLAYENYLGLSFQNGSIGQEIYTSLSGTCQQYTNSDKQTSSDNSARQQMYLESIVPDGVNPEFINVAFSQPLITKGIKYAQNINLNDESYLQKLIKIKIGVQVNTRYLSNMLNVAKVDASTSNYANFNNIQSFSDALGNLNTQNNDMTLSDYQTFLPYIDVISGVTNVTNYSTEIVGFIIDKSELLANGNSVEHQPIFVDNSQANEVIDFRIRYNAYYVYKIRTIYKMYVPAIDELTNDVVLLVVLVSSKPSSQSYAICTENIPPPPVSNLDFVWDYRRINLQSNKPGSLMIHWSFPTNSQRDIKYFQIFRRRTTETAFELIKMYHFNDADVQPQLREKYDSNLVEQLSSPKTYFIDDEFVKTSKYIYTVCTMDAHGYISNYGEQFEVWFDRHTNSLQKKLISHSGALRPYPNLYVENDLFVDAIKTSGEHSKTMKIYFNPEYYRLYDEQGQNMNLLQTKQHNGKYKLQFINVDNQKDVVVDINIDDPMGVTEESYVRGSRFWG
jgi:hypothetical protein